MTFRIPKMAVPGVLLILVMVAGGSSRDDALGPSIANAFAVVVLAALALRRRWSFDRALFMPLICLVSLALLIVLQLIPIPPVIWNMLPGHAGLLDAAYPLSLRTQWRPLTLSPDETASALLYLLPSAAALALAGSLSAFERRKLLFLIPVMAVTSGLLGLVQFISRSESFFFYEVVDVASTLGVFSNRNHQALLLAAALPTLALVPDSRRIPLVAALSLIALTAIFLIASVITTGSRFGLLVALFGTLALIVLLIIRLATRERHKTVPRARLIAIGVLFAAMLVVVVIASQNALSIQRLLVSDQPELRWKLLPSIAEIGWLYFPFGSGFGSFVDVFKVHEPLDSLQIAYLNHAHNELLHVFVEGGLLGFAIVALFTAWCIGKLVDSGHRDSQSKQFDLHRIAAGTVAAMILMSSLVDYPLRTANIAVVMVLAIANLPRPAGDRSALGASRQI